MQALQHVLGYRQSVSFAASAALHLGFALLLILFVAAPPPPVPVESIVVDLVSPAEITVEPMPMPVPAPAPTPAALPVPPPDLTAKPDTLIRATRLYSQASLAKPKNREARKALPHLAPAERMEQLCDIEAMDQVHAWKAAFEPERLVAYAFADTVLSGGTIRADGAAFRSRHRWFHLRFECALSADGKKVASFAFEVGNPVPEAEWDEHNLPALE